MSISQLADHHPHPFFPRQQEDPLQSEIAYHLRHRGPKSQSSSAASASVPWPENVIYDADKQSSSPKESAENKSTGNATVAVPSAVASVAEETPGGVGAEKIPGGEKTPEGSGAEKATAAEELVVDAAVLAGVEKNAADMMEVNDTMANLGRVDEDPAVREGDGAGPREVKEKAAHTDKAAAEEDDTSSAAR